MSIHLDHTIVHARNNQESATFLAEILGLPRPEPFLHFFVVRTGNGVCLDFISTDEEIQIQHYAFLVNDQEFDSIFSRIKQRNIPYWADPAASRPGEINHYFGGRGCYFRDPAGHYLEIITKPYDRSGI